MSDIFPKKLVSDTFENSFNKEQFTLFIKNLLNYIDDSEEARFIYQGQYIPEVYQDSVLSLERIGKYTDPEDKTVDILVVNLKKEKSLDRARTLQRNFVAWYLDGSRGGKLKDAALVAFVSPNLDSWRFSLVKMDYKIQEAKVKKDLTPAKRYSFLVGSQEKSHTAQSRLIPIIEDDKNNPSLKQIEEAFNIEKVTKEFFEKYRDLFVRLKESLDDIVSKDKKIKEDFEKKNIDTTGFTKKLLGQIVFLYFLQKKGWFGVERDSLWGTGPKNFLRVLFNKKIAPYKNFFNDVLEPLFYEALAIKREDDYYGKLDCKIPFLNGGLFDPINDYDWVHTDINIDNELFSNKFRTKEGDEGNGILDVFDRYNFTVWEDEPLEKEVAVDPEMLGKVFENLLEVKDRKSKGTYYTPREIVHYMCQESLINYLYSEMEDKISKEDLEILVKRGIAYIHNDQSVSLGIKKYEEKIPKSIKKFAPLIDIKLADIKVCDPAVGSGAFLVSMMNEIVNVREVLGYMLGDVKERNTYKFKRWAIQHSLYGVDIDPSAVEIAKLRLWLSLVVEEGDIKKIKPLPNLDYKIMQGNSLLEEFKGVKLFDEKLLTKGKPVEYDVVGELKLKENELSHKLLTYYLKNPRWMSNKQITRPPELAQIEMEMVGVKAALKKNINDIKEQKDKPHQPGFNFLGGTNREDTWLRLKKLYGRYFKSYDRDKKKQLRDSIEKVIWELIETTIMEEGKLDTLKEIAVYKNNGIRPFFLWKLYFADVFREKGGFDVVIANPPYVGEKGHKDMFRELRNGNLSNYYQRKMDLFYFFFHLALNISKNNATVGFISTNYYLTATGAKTLREDFKNRAAVINLINFNELKIFESATGQHNIITILRKTSDKDLLAINLTTQRKGVATPEILSNILYKNDSDTSYFKVPQENLFDGRESYIRMSGVQSSPENPVQKILNKIDIGTYLEGICFINMGVQSGADFVGKKLIERAVQFKYVSQKYLEENKIGINTPIYVVDRKFKIKLPKRERRILKKFVKNSDIKKYRVSTSDRLYYIYADSQVDINNYPSVKKYLQKFRPILRAREQVNDRDNSWYWIRGSKRQYFVDTGEHIICPYRTKTNTFALTDGNTIGAGDVYLITRKDTDISIRYLLALLNSKLYFIWIYNRGKRKGETLELYQKPLSEIPVKKISETEQKPFIDVVNKILEITKSDDYVENIEKQAKVIDYKNQIDRMVYGLYGLSKEEIDIVEDLAK
jgi:hypothetical protein